ncbi:MAG TPA: hypothetical protein VIV60_18565 [Polyangiaceae bacterium]
MATKRLTELLLFLAAALIGCSSSDKDNSAGGGNVSLAGAHGSLGGSGGLRGTGEGGAKPIAGSNAVALAGTAGSYEASAGGGPIAGAGAGGASNPSRAGAAGTNAIASGGVAGVPSSFTLGGTSSQGGGAVTTLGGAAGSVSTAPSSTVWSWGQKGNEGPLADLDWPVDNARGAYDGVTSAHPPSLLAATPVELTIDCGAQAHTEFSFYLARITSAPVLELLVDGAVRHKFSNNGTWSFSKYVFDVPEGTHVYTFRAQSTSDAATSFALDSIVCKVVEPAVAANATVDFDRGFIPPETKGGWLIDNAIDTYSDGAATSDEAAIHPPALLANTPVEMTFDCGQTAHTELSFYLARLTTAPNLEMLVDGVVRHKFSNNGTWDFYKYVFDVPLGAHTYTFRAQSANDVATSFAIDFLQCKNTVPAVAANATVDFDRGFIPPETKGGWLIDNAIDTYSDGAATSDEAAIHPPALLANTPVEMTFDCGQTAHTELSFYLARLTTAPNLEMLVDGVVRHKFSNNGTWDFYKYVFDVPLGTHTYTFRAQSVSDVATSFAIDFLQCKNNPPAVAENATIDFDRGFIPPEIGGGWLVDNAVDTYSDGSKTTDEAAAHPPLLKAATPVDMTFDCGQASHSKLSFYLSKLASAPTLELLVDGARFQDLSGSGTWSFKKYTFDVSAGTHSYTFRAESAGEAATSFVVDFLYCAP